MYDDSQHTKELLEIKRRRLQVLERQSAKYGIECPASIIMEIEDLLYEIKSLGGSKNIAKDIEIIPEQGKTSLIEQNTSKNTNNLYHSGVYAETLGEMRAVAATGAQVAIYEAPPHLIMPSGHLYLGQVSGSSIDQLYREHDGQIVLRMQGLAGESAPFLIDKYQITARQFCTFLNDLIDQDLAQTEISSIDGARFCTDALGNVLAFDAEDRWRRGHSAKEPWIYAASLWGIKYTKSGWQVISGNDVLPATLVTWQGARLYSLWAQRQLFHHANEDIIYLPTVQQWHIAACYDGVLKRFLRFPWGNTWRREMSNYSGYWVGYEVIEAQWNQVWGSMPQYYKQTRPLPVASLDEGRSPVGCVQMIGNVWEWCRDIAAEGQATRHAIKGGACLSPQEHCYPDRSSSWKSTQGNEYIGFRCCISLSQ